MGRLVILRGCHLYIVFAVTFGVHGAIDFNEFSTLEINRFVAAIYRTERFSSRQGLDPWVELRKRRRVDLFGGRIEALFPLNPVVAGLNSSDIAFQRVRKFFDSLGSARRGRGLDTSRHGNAGLRSRACVQGKFACSCPSEVVA